MERRESPVATRLIALLAALAASCPVLQEASAQATAEVVEPARAAIRLKDYGAAADLLRPLAERGDPQAQYLLASLSRVGLGAAVDLERARGLLTAAAGKGHASAAYSLAMLLANEAPRDVAQANVWLKRAADMGHALALSAVQRGALPLQFLPQKDLTEPHARRAALWLAAQQDDVQLASMLTDDDMLKRTDEFGRGVLAVAAQSDAAQTVAMLLRRGSSPDQADSFGITPLMLGARSANVAVLDSLLGANAALDAVDRVGNSALMYAAAAGQDKALARLLSAGANASLLNAQAWSALDWAIESRAPAAVELLRQHGLSTRRAPERIAGSPAVPLQRATAPAGDLYRGLSDLQVAASRSSPALFKTVVEHERAAGRAPVLPEATLFSAAVTGSSATLDAVFAAGVKPVPARGDPLPWLLMRGERGALTNLLARRPDLSAANNRPLLIAVASRRPDAVKALLSSHADTEIRDDAGRTPLMLAAASGQTDIARELLDHLAKTDAVDKAGRTALWYASAAGEADLVAALLAGKSEVDTADALGLTALAVASARGHIAVVDSLLRAGAKAKTSTRNGSTPLMLAAGGGHTNAVALLLAADVRIDDQNRHGDTALIIAARAGQLAAVRQLLAAGASGKLRNADRVSALDVANALALPEIAALLQRS